MDNKFNDSKSIVKDFLGFLDTHEGLISTSNMTYTYAALRDSILNTIEAAMEFGKEEAILQDLFEVSHNKEW